jgi:hypothetical protein
MKLLFPDPFAPISIFIGAKSIWAFLIDLKPSISIKFTAIFAALYSKLKLIYL